MKINIFFNFFFEKIYLFFNNLMYNRIEGGGNYVSKGNQEK
ncbi:hypothetical protein HMPREF1049_1891 [Fusobacterium necrophorum subsp. funduliforme ATCC 51357]|uniref:Uncharacterized protein n=1 Tax=Fusobacterium necrophorum subsp. funduliforme Fnf 1007 TaxID=1161424 RepID=A0AAN4ATZ5_9FUSO|nr:hypothetical protein HMPREF1049_1891 [Fusobacterium necrophorum subsp. funduliforme ATCC 51357]EJU18259.1 hypothetical protein HMPREF1127_1832 [Fusobacterium necrophorum subsp. funduliforme Fnf 1007]